MKTVVFCPKCKSERVAITRSEPEDVRKVSMDKLGLPNTTMERWPEYWRAVCEECGYTVDFTQ